MGGGTRTGLDYSAMRVVIEMMGATPTAQLLDDLQSMEVEAMRLLNGK